MTTSPILLGSAMGGTPGASSVGSSQIIDGSVAVSDLAPLSVEDVTAASYTFVAGDAGKLKRFDRATAQTATVPPNSSVAFAVGTIIEVAQVNAGTLTIAAGSGVTINAPGGTLSLGAQWAAARLIKTGTDRWILEPLANGTYVGAKVFGTTQAVTTAGTGTVLTFGTSEEFDTSGFHDLVTNPERITVPTGLGGKYLVHAAIDFAANATGFRGLILYVNNTTEVCDVFQPTSTGHHSLNLSAIITLNAGDYVNVRGYQTSGGNLNVITTQFSPFLSAVRLPLP